MPELKDAKPYTWTASGKFEGVDGSWSTFYINAGDNGNGGTGQDFRILPATGISGTFVPLKADWCTVPNANDCAANRGIEPTGGRTSQGFTSQDASGYDEQGIYNLNWPATALRYGNDTKNQNADYGYTVVGLGVTGPTTPQLTKQIVGGLHTMDYYMGYFGLSNIPINFGRGAIQSFIETFHVFNNTPSISYGYTAGASYKNTGVPGNLVLGGYDSAAFDAGRSKSIAMPGADNSSLVVGVQSINIRPAADGPDTNRYSGTPNGGFFATIDSTLPYLWLPRSSCDALENIFGLHYDDKQQLYLVNESSRTNNKIMNPTIQFQIGSSQATSNDAVTISLTYDAFDLEAKWPFYTNATRYFPIKRSPTGLFVLGRTFLQEAYVFVDYHRKNFTVSQATFANPMPSPSVIPVWPPKQNEIAGSPTPTPTLIGGGSKGKSGLSTGAIAGISIAAVVIVIIIAVLIFFFRRQKIHKEKVRKTQPVLLIPEDMPVAQMSQHPAPPPYDSKGRRISELESPTPTPGYASSRTSSQGGIHGELESPDSNYTDTQTKNGYFDPAATGIDGRLRSGSDPSYPVYELPAEERSSELDSLPPTPEPGRVSPARPSYHRSRRSHGGSGGSIGQMNEAQRVTTIEEDPNEGTMSSAGRPHSRFQEDLDDSAGFEKQMYSDNNVPPLPHHAHQTSVGSRMTADEAAGLEGGEPGPAVVGPRAVSPLQEDEGLGLIGGIDGHGSEIGHVPASGSARSSITLGDDDRGRMG